MLSVTMTSPFGRKSLLSLNNWSNNNNNNNHHHHHHHHHQQQQPLQNHVSGAKQRSNSSSSCRTTSGVVGGMLDFWSRVSQQMAYIDGSTRSSSLIDAASDTQPPPPATPASASCSQDNEEAAWDSRRPRRNASIYENYFPCADDDEGLELQPLPTSTTFSSVVMETASVGGATAKLHRYQTPMSTGGKERRSSTVTGAVPRKASSWEESEALQRRRSVMIAAASCPLQPSDSELQLLNKRDLKYYFQHPYPRLFVTYFVIFCNFLLFAEDPISHSHTESDIPMVGNVFSFVLTKYPPEWRWSFIKVLMWIFAILCGMILGKLLIHGYLCGTLLRLKMFRDDQGSWMTMFLTVIVSLYVFSHAYNLLLALWYGNYDYQITSHMGVTNASVMKAAACGTWLGDLITALMVTDMMLQDNLYPEWATGFRALWRKSNIPRILIFWVGSILATSIVVTLIVSDWISWDNLNKDLLATNELSRAFLASFILVMDLLIVMQDWDFPHFTTTLHVNLPGFSVATLQWKYAEVDVTGKWFNYGIIFLVMLLDLNMWKNQIFYDPKDYGQYTGPDKKVHTVNEQELLKTGNVSYWTWESRSQLNPESGAPFYEEDMQMNSRYMGYPLSIKWTAFIPSGIGLSLFVGLISLYGRFPADQDPVEAVFRGLATIRQGLTLPVIGIHDWIALKKDEF